MCGRYALWGIDLLGQHYLIHDPTLGLRSRFNIAPQSENPVIVAAADGNHLRMMEWGLVPHWTKDLKAARRPINARAETLSDKPMFRSLLSRNRCIIPANGFYEWKKTDHGKEPYFICRSDKGLFGFAGLFDTWQSPDGHEILTYTIITTTSNEILRPIHNRMPVILSPDREAELLSVDSLSTEALGGILVPYPETEMIAYPVSVNVNAVGSEGEDLIREKPGGMDWFG